MPDLRQLVLSFNRIELVSTSALSRYPKLTYLSLERNAKLGLIDDGIPLPRIKGLRISETSILKLPRSIYSTIRVLEWSGCGEIQASALHSPFSQTPGRFHEPPSKFPSRTVPITPSPLCERVELRDFSRRTEAFGFGTPRKYRFGSLNYTPTGSTPLYQLSFIDGRNQPLRRHEEKGSAIGDRRHHHP